MKDPLPKLAKQLVATNSWPKEKGLAPSLLFGGPSVDDLELLQREELAEGFPAELASVDWAVVPFGDAELDVHFDHCVIPLGKYFWGSRPLALLYYHNGGEIATLFVRFDTK